MTLEEFKTELNHIKDKVIFFKKYEHKQAKTPASFGKISREPKEIPSQLALHKRRLRDESLRR